MLIWWALAKRAARISYIASDGIPAVALRQRLKNCAGRMVAEDDSASEGIETLRADRFSIKTFASRCLRCLSRFVLTCPTLGHGDFLL